MPKIDAPSTNSRPSVLNHRLAEYNSRRRKAVKKLSKRDLDNLRASGLKDSTIRKNQLQTEYESERLAAILNRSENSICCTSGLVIPYRNLDGEVNCFARVRPHFPRTRKDKPIKYEQPVGEPSRAFFPAESIEGLNSGGDVFITEGEKKSLALAQAGRTAIGLGGVECGRKNGELIDDLQQIEWDGRVVYICFDYDDNATTRRSVDAAKRRLAKKLQAEGAEVYDVQLPPAPNGGKQGVDDFLVAHGKASFTKLVDNAVPIESPHTPTEVDPNPWAPNGVA